MLAVGTEAPGFKLVSHTGDTVTLASFKGFTSVVLIFYPGDETPGCTKQLCAIRDEYSSFEDKGAVVFGVNPASADSHKKFVEAQHYQFPLLVDEGSAVAAAYQAKGNIMNKRTVYVIGKDGKIVFAQKGKPPVSKILESIKP